MVPRVRVDWRENIHHFVPQSRGVYELGWFDREDNKFKPVYIERATGDEDASSLRDKLVQECQKRKDNGNLFFRFSQVESPAKTMARLLDFWGTGRGCLYEWNTDIRDNNLIEDEKKEDNDAATLFDPSQ